MMAVQEFWEWDQPQKVKNGVMYLYTRKEQKEVVEDEDNIDMCG